MRTPRSIAVASLALILGLSLAALLPGAASANPGDPLFPLLFRMHRYFQRNETDGVTLDWRVVVNRSEAIRLSVISQLLGYVEIYRVVPLRSLRRDVAQHADFLVANFDEITSGTAFDGMLGYSLLGAYEVTRDARYLEKGTVIVRQLEALSPSETILNGGLMAAMALAKYHQLTGDAEAERRTREILASQPAYQHADGSFPHWCPCSTDIHYTGWMAMELILIQRMLDDPLIDPMLGRMLTFMEGRVDSSGNTRYEEECPDYAGCRVYYYSIATGCTIDYDTRAFTNELGYSALLFDHFRSPRYRPVMRFLDALEDRGAIADKWDYWPPPDDPYYVWTASDTSVVNMSVIFWSLASILGGRRARLPVPYAWLADGEDGYADEAAWLPPSSGGNAGIRSHGWRTADSLLAAGADPAAYCYEEPASGGAGDDGRPRRQRLPLATPAADPAGTDRTLPAATRLEPILPNPARGDCDVRFALSAPARASLAICDASGRRVRELVSGPFGAGRHAVRWDGADAAGARSPSGIYFVVLRAGGDIRATRVILIH